MPPSVTLALSSADQATRWRSVLGEHFQLTEDGDVLITDHDAPPSGPTILLSADRADAHFSAGFAAVLDSPDPRALIAAIHAVLAGLLVHSNPAPSNQLGVPPLTPREQEVLELLAQGMSNGEIGRILGISGHTAKFHVQRLLDKLDATTRTEAAVRAARMLMI